MDITRAFTYIFEDEDWTGKIVMVVIWSLVAAIPLVGLLGVAILAGWTVELISNLREGVEHPLPAWDNLGDKLALGANVLVAAIIYNLGNFLLACGYLFLVPSLGFESGTGAANTANSIALGITCCLTLVMLVYNLIIWPLLSMGLIWYSDAREIGVFFQVDKLAALLNRNSGQVIQWILFSIFAGIVIGFFNLIPCIGQLAAAALSTPVQAHLLGQLALQIDQKPKRKPKPSSSR